MAFTKLEAAATRELAKALKYFVEASKQEDSGSYLHEAYNCASIVQAWTKDQGLWDSAQIILEATEDYATQRWWQGKAVYSAI
jgi:HD-like signal output (HDOD) protein